MLTKNQMSQTGEDDAAGETLATLAWAYRQFIRGIRGGFVAVALVAIGAVVYFTAPTPQVFATSIEFALQPVRTADGFSLDRINHTTVYGSGLTNAASSPEELALRHQQMNDAVADIFEKMAYSKYDSREFDIERLNFNASVSSDRVYFTTTSGPDGVADQAELHQATADELVRRISDTRAATARYAAHMLDNYKSNVSDLSGFEVSSNPTLVRYQSANELQTILQTLIEKLQGSENPNLPERPAGSINIGSSGNDSIAASAKEMLERREQVAASVAGLDLSVFALQSLIDQAAPEEVNFVARQTNEASLVAPSIAIAAFIFLGLMAFLIGPFVWVTCLMVRDELKNS